MNIGTSADSNINLSVTNVLSIVAGIGVVALALYFFLPVWAFLGLMVGVTASVNIACVVLAALHFLRSKH